MSTKGEITNVKTAYLLTFVSETFFPIAIWLFFYLQYLDFKQVALISAAGNLFTILLEVPTGAFADIYGRRKAIILSQFLYCAVMVFTAFSQSFYVFLVLAFFNALSTALYSGSLEALVYDSLKENKQEHRFDKVISRLESLTWSGLFVASVLGGILYQFDFRLPYLAQALFALCAGILALRLREPKIDSKKYEFKQMISQNVTGFRELFQTRRIAIVSLTFITLGAGYYVASSILGISQVREYGISPAVVGIIFGVGYILSAATSYIFPKLKEFAGAKLLLIGTSIILIGSFLLAKDANIALGVGLIILRIASSTTFRNIRSTVLNGIFSSRNRATAISTVNLLSSLPYVLTAYFIGDVIDKTSPNHLAFILGGIMVFALVFIQLVGFVWSRKTKSA